MYNPDKPKWQRFDTLKSIYSLGKQALISVLDRADTHYADRWNDNTPNVYWGSKLKAEAPVATEEELL